ETVTHPSQFSKYTYDLREKVKTVSVGKSATDTDPKVTAYTYTDRGQKLKETKDNGNTADHTYYLNGALKSAAEKKANGTLVASHTYAYDANGNKSQDVAKKMNADNHAAYLDSTTDYAYDPADRLIKTVKTGNGAGTDTYVHDDNANVISQTVKNVTTAYEYDRNRLLRATAGGSAANYSYDPFGRQQSVNSGGKVIGRSVYDGFDHVIESQKMDAGGAMKSTTYTFDPLDRTATKTAAGKTTDFEYLGLSGEVLDEKVAGELTKSYQYSPWGERLSQVKHNTDGTTEEGYYGYNSHTDVETLTDKNGDTKATYGYTAYGSNDDTEFTGIDKPEAGDPTKEEYNPYRFNAKRWDTQSGTYDMGFRDYNPGLNRFTTRDMYNGALADMGLGSDPFTGNRYAFTGGNPVSGVELDGHLVWFGIPAVYYGWAALFGTAAVAATPQGQENLQNAGQAIGSMLRPSADDSASSGSSARPRSGPTPAPSANPAPRPQPRSTDNSNFSCNPTPLIDGGRIYGGLEEYTNHQGKNGCRATGAFAFLTKADRRSRTGANGMPKCSECEPSVSPDGMGEIAAGGGKPQAGHLIGYWGKGTGQDVRNLVALHGKANARMAGNVERFGWTALNRGNTLIMSVTPVYGDPRSAVPTTVQVGMTEYGRGGIVDTFSCTAINSRTGLGSTC
ncbi:RHS repeat-associated core domain-containing protein, partial [Streptomyces sp. NPDC056352]|uniref:RHS repeat-associated core domain-containing protein n=1 Tax=Streptomyces sp. NPDC056352 TaxID=3345791 RepID=UPI0035D7DAAB